MRASWSDPFKLAYETFYGPYNWNRYPLAPLGCKAVVYVDRDTTGLWASRGVDGWYLGPLMDHYWWDVYYIPETRGYRVLGSTEPFLQHCQLPDMTPHQHLCALTNKLCEDSGQASMMPKGKHILRLLHNQLHIWFTCPSTYHGGTKGEWKHITWSKRGWTKGDWWLTHHHHTLN